MTSVTNIVDNDIIDLSRFVKFAGRQKRIILSGLAIGALLGLAFGMISSAALPVYTSETTILLSGPKYKVQLEDKLLTNDKINEAQAAVRAREAEYTAIARSIDVRRATAELLGDLLSPEQVQAGSLPADVSVRVSGSLVALTARSREAGIVQQVASAYAIVVSKRLDEVYGQSETDLANIQLQLQASTRREQVATEKVEANTRTSRLQDLETQLAQKQALRDTVVSGINTSLANDLQSKLVALSALDQLSQDVDTLRDSIATSGSSTASRSAQASALYSLETKLATLNSTLTQRAPVGASLAVPKDSSVTKESPAPVPGESARVPFQQATTSQIRVQADALAVGTTQAQLLADVVGLRQTIERRRVATLESVRKTNDALVEQIKGARGISDDGTGAANLLLALSQDIQTLIATIQLEKQRIVVLQRDQEVATTTSDALSKKVAEITIGAGLTGGKAIVASGASEAARVDEPLRTTGIVGGVLGLCLGLAFAVYRDRHRKERGRRSVTTAVAST